MPEEAVETAARDHPDLVKAFVEAYLRAAYAHGADDMVQLVIDDAKKTGSEKLGKEQKSPLLYP